MNKEEFIAHLADIIQTDEKLSEDSVLGDFSEWDSLAVMSTISFVEENFHKNLTFSDLGNVVSVSDLLKLVGLK